MSTGTLWASCDSSASSLSSPKPKPPPRSLRTRRTFQSFSRERAPPAPVFSSESAPGSCGAVNSYDKSSLTEEKEDTTSSEEDHSSIASARSNNWAECRDQKSVGAEPTGKMSLDNSLL